MFSSLQGESVDLTLYLSEVNSNRNILLALDSNAKILGRDGNLRQKCDHVRRWRNVCQRRLVVVFGKLKVHVRFESKKDYRCSFFYFMIQNFSIGWVDCWSVPIVALSIHYTYHPAPPLGPPPQANITTPEKEEILLSPMRIPHGRKTSQMKWQQVKICLIQILGLWPYSLLTCIIYPNFDLFVQLQDSTQKLDPTTMPADTVLVELEIGPSVMLLYGSLLRNFMHLKVCSCQYFSYYLLLPLIHAFTQSFEFFSGKYFWGRSDLYWHDANPKPSCNLTSIRGSSKCSFH